MLNDQQGQRLFLMAARFILFMINHEWIERILICQTHYATIGVKLHWGYGR